MFKYQIMNDKTIDITEQVGVFESIKSLMQQTLNPKFLTHTAIGEYKTGVHTGFTEIDKITNGILPGELVTIAVRPGIGKTAFMLSLLNNIAICNEKKVGVFSAERSAKKIFSRIIESSTGLPINKINGDRLTDSQLNVVYPVMKNLAKADIYIDDHSNPYLEDIITKSRAMVEMGIEVIFVDYLELLKTELTTKDKACDKEQFCIIVKLLNDLAKELEVPIILFSQLSQPIIYNNRFKYTPDYINENSDILMFVNRPDYYHINDIDGKEKGIAEITIAKNRDETEFTMVKLKFVESLDKFSNLN